MIDEIQNDIEKFVSKYYFLAVTDHIKKEITFGINHILKNYKQLCKVTNIVFDGNEVKILLSF